MYVVLPSELVLTVVQITPYSTSTCLFGYAYRVTTYFLHHWYHRQEMECRTTVCAVFYLHRSSSRMPRKVGSYLRAGPALPPLLIHMLFIAFGTVVTLSYWLTVDQRVFLWFLYVTKYWYQCWRLQIFGSKQFLVLWYWKQHRLD